MSNFCKFEAFAKIALRDRTKDIKKVLNTLFNGYMLILSSFSIFHAFVDTFIIHQQRPSVTSVSNVNYYFSTNSFYLIQVESDKRICMKQKKFVPTRDVLAFYHNITCLCHAKILKCHTYSSYSLFSFCVVIYFVYHIVFRA